MTSASPNRRIHRATRRIRCRTLLKMERAGAHWTDQRLDDMAHRMDEGFARVDRRMDEGFARVDADIRELRGEMNTLRTEMNARFDAAEARTDSRFDAFQRTMLQLGGGMMVTFVVGFASILIAQLA